MRATIPELAAAIRARDRFLLLTHKRPDGDTLGSAAALCRGLRALGKQAALLWNPEAIARYDPFLEGLTTPEIPADAVLFAVDLAAETLLPANAEALAGRIDLCIDHHGSNRDYAALSVIAPEHAACGETDMALLEELGLPVTPPMATALYLALSTDTGCFRFSNTSPNTLRRAAELMEAGADVYAINRQFFSIKSLSRLRLESLLGERLETLADGRVAVCVLTPQLMERCGAGEDDIEDLANFPRQIEGVVVAVYIRVLSDGTSKISLRTDPGVDASAICAHLGGGGHPAAAGASIAAPWEVARMRILDAIEQETGLPCQPTRLI